MASKPIADTIWRGSFMISNPKISLNLNAHLSSKAGSKVWQAAKQMAQVLCPELLPRRDVWPKSFKSSKLIDDNIDIYFFSVKGRDDQVLDSLLLNLEHYDIAIKALVGDAELLIFTSARLPEKHQRFEGKLYLWGVFVGRQAPPSDFFIHNTRVTQASSPNLSNEVGPGNDRSCEEFSNTESPSPASKSARKGRPLDHAWQHATPVNGKKQRTICKYCGFVSSSGGITLLKAHLGGGDPTGSLKGCPNVPPEVKGVMLEWLKGTVRGVKAPQLEEIRRDLEASASKKLVKRGRPLDPAWTHATPIDSKRQRAVCKYCGFISSSGGITLIKAHLAGGNPAGHSKGCPSVPPEVRRMMAEWLNRTVKEEKATQPEETRGYLKAEFDLSPTQSDDCNWYRHTNVKNAQHSNFASGGNSFKDARMSRRPEAAYADCGMEVIGSQHASNLIFSNSKPSNQVGNLQCGSMH